MRNLLRKGVAIHFLIAWVNVFFEFSGLAGEEGLISCRSQLSRIQNEFDIIHIVQFFPSLLWFMSYDILFYLGLVTAVLAIILDEGLAEKAAFLIIWTCWLSLTVCRGLCLWFPWDCLLAECLLFCAFSFPAWSYRLLLFRLIFGFGKHKFLGSSLRDADYLLSMSCWQPLSSSIGIALAHPSLLLFHRLGILYTFITEMILPFGLLTSRAGFISTSCGAIGLLMLVIQIVGHFAWFNSLTVCICLFVWENRSLKPVWNTYSLIKRFLAVLYIIAAIVFLVPSQWNSPSVFYEPAFPLGDIFATISSWRLLHSYGVFPPKSLPMIKPVSRFEVLYEKSDFWIPLDYVFQSSRASPSVTIPDPFTVAPLIFPRFDYIVGFYSASHVFSLVSGLGPLWGTGTEMVDSLVCKLFDNGTSSANWFATRLSERRRIEKIRSLVVGLAPDGTGGWLEISSYTDREWDRAATVLRGGSDTQPSFVQGLPPTMNRLRFHARATHEARSCPEHWQESVRTVDRRLTSYDFHLEVTKRYALLTDPNGVFCGPSPWSIDYSSRWAGYLSCLTAFHLIPMWYHPALCGEILVNKALHDEEPYNKIPIPSFVYDKWNRVMGRYP